MVKQIVKDPLFLQQKSGTASYKRVQADSGKGLKLQGYELKREVVKL
jgi:hypothetical protein